MQNKMRIAITGKLPAGIADKNVEFFAQGEQVFAIMGGQMHPIQTWPDWLAQAIEDDMAKHPEAVEALVDADIVGRAEMIEQYVKCRYSVLDNSPDMINGQLQPTEYTTCSLRGTCPYEGRLCDLLKAPHGTLTHREIAVLKLIPEGLLDKEIAERLGISPLTVGVYMRNLREKIGANNKASLVRFALQKRLI